MTEKKITSWEKMIQESLDSDSMGFEYVDHTILGNGMIFILAKCPTEWASWRVEITPENKISRFGGMYSFNKLDAMTSYVERMKKWLE